MKPSIRIPINIEEYGLEGMELAAVGAIKYGLEKMEIAEALARLDDLEELLWEVIKTVSVNDLDTGTLRVRKNIVDYVKTINITEVLVHPSDGFQQFLADCRDALNG